MIPDDPFAESPHERESFEREPSFPVVGIGASAGGLEAYRQVLQALPPDTGMAFALIQHLDPTHESMLAEILGRETTMPVTEVRSESVIEPNHVYVIPPRQNMVVTAGVLKLLPREDTRGQHRPVDSFLRSLAEDRRHLAVGVILSGTGNDGTLGLEAIKAEGGIAIAQDDTAQHDGMPRSAIAAGCVDFVLSPDRIAEELTRIARHPYVASEQDRGDLGKSAIEKVLSRVHAATGMDFTHYRSSTLYRRISRRMILHKLDGLSEYAQLLEDNAEEVQALRRDILISVTSFFRDPDAFDVLKAHVFPRLVQGRARQDPLRIWVLGCSTGEEAYSVAITLSEVLDEAPFPIQVFATDLNDLSIEKARAGLYSKAIAQDVSPERLRRFFLETEGGYQISKRIRDMCIFAKQNVLADPPFSHLDLITCRNVLIYMEPMLQRKLLPLFHYALRPSGFLWLGSSESVGGFPDLFEPEDSRHKVYVKKPGAVPLLAFPISASAWQLDRPDPSRRFQAEIGVGLDVQREADRLALARYSPAGVLVNANLDILQFRGDTSPFLAPAPGKPSLSLLKMAREGLLVGMRAAVQQAFREGKAVRQEGLLVRSNSDSRQVNLEVLPVRTGASPHERSLLVMFEEAVPANLATPSGGSAPPEARSQEEAERQVHRLTQELAATREYLQSLIEQQEAANEELQSANEEIQSANEELQSTNEELQTSKEEIQSSNEELTTVNEEMRDRNEQLGQANSDLANFLASSQLPLVMLGRDLRLRRFTPQAEKLLNLLAGDVSRPISDLRLSIDVPDLEQRLREVIDTVVAQEREVQDRTGRWYSLHLRPYKTLDNRIDGAVMVLVDITAQKEVQAAIEESEHRFRLLANSAPVLIWVNDVEGRQFVNRTYLDYLGVGEGAVTGNGYLSFVHPDDRDGYVAAYADACAPRKTFQGQFRFRRADGEYRWMKTVGIPRVTDVGELVGYVGSTVDIHDMKQIQDALQESEKRLAADLTDMTRLQQVSARVVRTGDSDTLLLEIVDAAIAVTGADMGNIQLLDRDSNTLRIVANRGFEAPFLDFFNSVREGSAAACGMAMQGRERMVVEDVATSPIFVGTEALDILRAANVRAVQSTPLFSRSGHLVGVFSTHYRTPRRPADRDLRLLDLLARQAADAIERIQIDEARRHEAARYQQIVDLMSAGVYSVDAAGVITFFNRRAVELWGRSPRPGETDEEFGIRMRADGSTSSPDSTEGADALRLGTVVRGQEVTVVRPDGSQITMQLNVDPIRDSAGGVIGAVRVLHDMTSLKTAETAMIEAGHRKDDFLATLAHELRNPLAAVSLTVRLLRRAEAIAPNTDDLDVLERQVEKLSRLVNDLLDVSRISQGKVPLQKAQIDLREVVRRTVQSMKVPFDAKTQELTVTLPPNPVHIEGDAVRLDQTVTNLLENASKFTQRGGRVFVTLELEGVNAIVRVRDTGAGISPELLPAIFDAYKQGGDSLEQSGGLGLGLFVVRKFVEMHGGSVSASSAGLGQGTEVVIRVPRLPAAVVEEPHAADESTPLRTLRILLVDDDPDVAHSLCRWLRLEGHEVRLESTGPAALEAAAAFQPDAVLLDIRLPGMDGYEVARRLRRQVGLEHVPLIAVSGYLPDPHKFKAAGFEEHLVKPVNAALLTETLARAIGAK